MAPPPGILATTRRAAGTGTVSAVARSAGRSSAAAAPSQVPAHARAKTEPVPFGAPEASSRGDGLRLGPEALLHVGRTRRPMIPPTLQAARQTVPVPAGGDNPTKDARRQCHSSQSPCARCLRPSGGDKIAA